MASRFCETRNQVATRFVSQGFGTPNLIPASLQLRASVMASCSCPPFRHVGMPLAHLYARIQLGLNSCAENMGGDYKLSHFATITSTFQKPLPPSPRCCLRLWIASAPRHRFLLPVHRSPSRCVLPMFQVTLSLAAAIAYARRTY
jgi:hypothetical protein